MAVWLGSLSLVLLAVYVRERIINRNLNKEVLYIRERLAALTEASGTRENGYVLVPSGNVGVRELSAQLNHLLETFYRQKAEYQCARQAMEQMLTNISHDLRTPLTVLKGYSELLLKEGKRGTSLPEFRDMAKKIDRKADELVRTIDEYFTMSKIESGDWKLVMRRVNVTQLCHELILDYYDVLEEAQYEVAIQVDDMPVYAYSDEEAVKRILKNMIDNAVRHGGSGKYLGIRLKYLADRIRIEVEDHGAGITAKDEEQIFSRNYTTARKGAGSGLGLTIARNLARQMGADIKVYSEPGIRTVFTLIL